MDTTDSMETAKNRLLDAALMHVAFDGWSETTFRAAMSDSDTPSGLARAIFPRGGIDMAIAYHRRGDAQMREALAATDLTALRFRDRIATAIKLRLAQSDREIVRRGAALFALPQNATDGAKVVWGTADTIWSALGDTSNDLSWYTKRASLSAVYSTTLLYWLGDDSADHQATWEFLDRRIGNVMRIEKAKTGFRENPLGKALMAGPFSVFSKVQPPQSRDDLPGHRP